MANKVPTNHAFIRLPRENSVPFGHMVYPITRLKCVRDTYTHFLNDLDKRPHPLYNGVMMKYLKSARSANALYTLFLFMTFFVITFFTGCSGSSSGYHWESDFNKALGLAKKSNRNILLLVTSDMDTSDSRAGVQLLLNTNKNNEENKESPANDKTFLEAVSDRYVSVHFDFSDLKARMSSPSEGATASEVKVHEKQKAALTSQFNIADSFEITSTPRVVLISKEGYYITALELDWTSDSLDSYLATLDAADGTVKDFMTLTARIKSGTVAERIAAIEELYERSSESNRLRLIDLFREAIKLDKKNETGKVSKFITALANAEAHQYLLNQEIDKAISTYELAAKDKRIDPLDAQTLYYIAANILGNTQTSDNNKRVLELLESAINASPDSTYAPSLRQLRDYVRQISGEQMEPDQLEKSDEDFSAPLESGDETTKKAPQATPAQPASESEDTVDSTLPPTDETKTENLEEEIESAEPTTATNDAGDDTEGEKLDQNIENTENLIPPEPNQ